MAGPRENFESRLRTDNKCDGKLEAKTILHTERKSITQPTTVSIVSTTLFKNGEMNWCAMKMLTGLFSLLHHRPGAAEKE